MSVYYDPNRTPAAKVLQGKLRQTVRKGLAWQKRHPGNDTTPAEATRFLLDRLEEGTYDYDSADVSQRHAARLVKRAVHKHLTNALDYCERHPEHTDTIGQLTRILEAVDSDRFKPRPMGYEAFSGPRNLAPSLGGLEALNTSENGAQRRTEAYAGLIDTEEYEKW